MLRPATPDALSRLLTACRGSDRELDRALTDLGVLPPLALTPIRQALSRSGTELTSARNADGHVVVLVHRNATVTAFIEHDGRTVAARPAAA